MSCKVVAVGTSTCLRCKQQQFMLPPKGVEFEYLDFDIKADRQKAIDLHGITSEDEVPTFLLYIDGKEMYRTFFPIPPQRVAVELARSIKTQEENQ